MKILNKTKLAAGLFALSVLMFSFTGCEKNPGSSSPSSVPDGSDESAAVTEEESSAPELPYNVKEIAPGHEYENIRQVQTCGDRVYIYEQNSELTEKEISVMAAADTKQVNEFDLEKTGYTYVQYTALGEKYLALIYSDEDAVQHLCTADAETGEKHTDTTFDNEYLSVMRSDGKDCYTVICITYTETGQLVHLKWFDGDLKTKRDENLSEKLALPESAVVVDAFAIPDGSAYICSAEYKMNFTVEYTLHRIDADGKVTYSQKIPEDWKGLWGGMYVSEKGSLCVCCQEDYQKYYVYELKRENGELIEEHKVETPKLSNFVSSFSLPGYDFAYISTQGLTGYSFAEKKSDLVFRFGEDLDSALKSSYTVSSFGNRIYLYNLANIEGGHTVTAVDAGGKEVMSAELKTDTGYVSGYCTSPDGGVIYCETYDIGIDSEDVGNSAFRFHVLDNTGKAKSIFTVDALKEAGNGVVQNMRCDKDGNIYMLIQVYEDNIPYPKIYVFDTEGKFKTKFTGEKEQLVITELLADGERNRAVCLNGDNENVIVSLDSADGLMKEEFRITPDSEEGESIIEGTGKSDLYYVKNNKIYGYTAADGTEKEIIDLSGTEFEITGALVVSDERVICLTYDQETGKTGVSEFSIG